MSAYVHKENLCDAHSSTINTLSFSSDGKYLASGADDHTLIIWKLADGRFILRLRFLSPVHVALWHPIYSETILVGCRDGVVCRAENFQLVSAPYINLKVFSLTDKFRMIIVKLRSISEQQEPYTVWHTARFAAI